MYLYGTRKALIQVMKPFENGFIWNLDPVELDDRYISFNFPVLLSTCLSESEVTCFRIVVYTGKPVILSRDPFLRILGGYEQVD